MSLHTITAEAIIQTNPDLRCTRRDKNTAEYRFVDGLSPNVLVFPKHASRILEAFRKPAVVRTALHGATRNDLELIAQGLEEGFLFRLKDIDRPRKGDELTRGLYRLGSRETRPLSAQQVRRHVIRKGEVGNREFFVLDGLFNWQEIRETYRHFSDHPFVLRSPALDNAKEYQHWGLNLPIDLPFFERVARCVGVLYPKLHLVPHKTTCNSNRYGDTFQLHVDDADPSVSAIYYANPKWEAEWQAETVLCDDAAEPLHLVAPKPGRVVLFRSDITHRGGVPSRLCYVQRIVLGMQWHMPR